MDAALDIGQLLILLVPLVIIQLGMMGFALYDLVRRKRVKGGSKLLWGVVIVLFEFVGPIVYFVVGREEDQDESDPV